MFPAIFAVAVALLAAGLRADVRPDVATADVDRIVAKYTAETPGCAVGAAVNGQQTLAKAYG